MNPYAHFLDVAQPAYADPQEHENVAVGSIKDILDYYVAYNGEKPDDAAAALFEVVRGAPHSVSVAVCLIWELLGNHKLSMDEARGFAEQVSIAATARIDEDGTVLERYPNAERQFTSLLHQPRPGPYKD